MTVAQTGVGSPVIGIGDTITADGFTAAAPAGNTLICALNVASAGVYEVRALTWVATPDANPLNIRLRRQALSQVRCPSVADPGETVIERLTCNAGDAIDLNVQLAGGAGAVYCGSLTVTRLS